MTVSEMCNAIAEHFDSLYLHKLGKSSVLLGVGVIIVVAPTAICVYEISRYQCDELIAEVLLTDMSRELISNLSPIGKMMIRAIRDSTQSKKLVNFKIELCDPNSLDKMDALVSRKIQEFADRGQLKWAQRADGRA